MFPAKAKHMHRGLYLVEIPIFHQHLSKTVLFRATWENLQELNNREILVRVNIFFSCFVNIAVLEPSL